MSGNTNVELETFDDSLKTLHSVHATCTCDDDVHSPPDGQGFDSCQYNATAHVRPDLLPEGEGLDVLEWLAGTHVTHVGSHVGILDDPPEPRRQSHVDPSENTAGMVCSAQEVEIQSSHLSTIHAPDSPSSPIPETSRQGKSLRSRHNSRSALSRQSTNDSLCVPHEDLSTHVDGVRASDTLEQEPYTAGHPLPQFNDPQDCVHDWVLVGSPSNPGIEDARISGDDWDSSQDGSWCLREAARGSPGEGTRAPSVEERRDWPPQDMDALARIFMSMTCLTRYPRWRTRPTRASTVNHKDPWNPRYRVAPGKPQFQDPPFLSPSPPFPRILRSKWSPYDVSDCTRPRHPSYPPLPLSERHELRTMPPASPHVDPCAQLQRHGAERPAVTKPSTCHSRQKACMLSEPRLTPRKPLETLGPGAVPAQSHRRPDGPRQKPGLLAQQDPRGTPSSRAKLSTPLHPQSATQKTRCGTVSCRAKPSAGVHQKPAEPTITCDCAMKPLPSCTHMLPLKRPPGAAPSQPRGTPAAAHGPHVACKQPSGTRRVLSENACRVTKRDQALGLPACSGCADGHRGGHVMHVYNRAGSTWRARSTCTARLRGNRDAVGLAHRVYNPGCSGSFGVNV